MREMNDQASVLKRVGLEAAPEMKHSADIVAFYIDWMLYVNQTEMGWLGSCAKRDAIGVSSFTCP